MEQTTLNFILGIAGTLIAALLTGAGVTVWRLTGEVRVLQAVVKGLAEDVQELKALVNQGRKWRFESGLGAQRDDR